MRISRFFLVGVMLALVTAVEAAVTVPNKQLGMLLSVPDGFVKDSERVQGEVVFAFRRPASGDEKVDTVIEVSRMGGVLGREKLDPNEVASRFPQGALTTGTWKGFSINVLSLPKQSGEVALVAMMAQVPLAPEAVQVTVCGEARHEAELKDTLQFILSNLDGETNWLNAEQQRARLTDEFYWIAVLVVIAIVVAQAVRARKTGGLSGP